MIFDPEVKAITGQRCGHEFRALTISRIVRQLDREREKFAQRRLEEPYPYVILDARYGKVGKDGAVRRRAIWIAIGISREAAAAYGLSNWATAKARRAGKVSYWA